MSGQTTYYELYRRSSIGMALTDALDQLITDGRIAPQLAMKILSNFDRHVMEVLEAKVKANMSFKGKLDTYRFCDEVWTFLLKDVTFKFQQPGGSIPPVTAEIMKIVSCNSKRPGET